MGHPKKIRKKYDTPLKGWDATRIEDEKILVRDFGLKNKKEIWKAETILRNFKRQIKSLIAKEGEKQAIKEEKDIRAKLLKLGFITAEADLENVLDLKVNDLLGRRLQSVVVRQGLARTPNQARQFIVHGHIYIGEKKMNVPSHLVSKSEEGLIRFDADSKLADAEHPERKIEEKEDKKILKEIKDKDDDKEVKKEAPKEKKKVKKDEKPVKKEEKTKKEEKVAEEPKEDKK